MTGGLKLCLGMLALWGINTWAATPSDFLYRNSAADGSGMPYRIFVPPGYDAGQAYPLIVFLHGAGERGNDNEAQLNNNANGAMQLISDANLAIQPLLMAAPQCPTDGWWGGATIETVDTIVDEIEAEFHIDPSRIYVTGLSMGGYGTWALTEFDPGRFAAAVPMSGGGDTPAAPSLSAMPFWFFHAADDGTVGVGNSDSLVAALRDAGASTIYTRYATGGHGIWPVGYATPLLFDWIVAQRLGAPSTTAQPILRVEQPTSDPIWTTQETTLELSGSADNAGNSIDSVGWDELAGSGGIALGTTNWSVAGIPLVSGTNLIRVTATGTSYYAPYGGNTTFNDSLRVNAMGPPPPPGSVVAAVNSAGDAYAASDGSTYVADTGFTGGSTQVSNVDVLGTDDDALYNNWRFGDFDYQMAVYNGAYEVELHFADTYNTAPGQRLFNVAIEGVSVLEDFDIIATIGANTALVRTFHAVVSNGSLDIALRNGSAGNARLDALRIIRSPDSIYVDGFESP